MVYFNYPQGNNKGIYANTDFPPQSGTTQSGIPPILGEMEYENTNLMEYENGLGMDYQ